MAYLSPALLELDVRVATAFPTNAPKTIAEMSSNEVIVAVNGYPLTKATYEAMMAVKTQSLMSQKNANQLIVGKQMEEYEKSYVRNFVGQRLLVDAAFREGVVTTNEVLVHLAKTLSESAKKRGITVEKVLKGFGATKRYFLYECGVSYVMNKLIHERIPPAMKVDPVFVAAVQKQVKEDNAAAVVTNEMLKARLASFRQQIISNKLDFVKAAARLAGELPKAENAGIWGEFEEGEMDDPRVAACAFGLREGQISDPVEDDNGYHVIKVLAILSPETNEEGRVIRKERRKLAHLYAEKYPMLIEEGDVVLTQDLKQQMQIKSVNDYTALQSTNGLNRIEFPNGENLFK